MYRAVRIVEIDAAELRRRREQSVAQTRREWLVPHADALLGPIEPLTSIQKDRWLLTGFV